jgi:hypothetical protein
MEEEIYDKEKKNKEEIWKENYEGIDNTRELAGKELLKRNGKGGNVCKEYAELSDQRGIRQK